MSSFTLFGIYVNSNQTKPVEANSDELTARIEAMLSHQLIWKVVVTKNWISRRTK